jgi:hypothetical protein
MEEERPFEPPYVAQFSSGDKKLIYLAAQHTTTEKYADLLNHPTFLSIKKIFAEMPIDAVIVEGIAPWVGEPSKHLLDHGDSCEATGYKVNCGEPWFAIQTAKKSGVSIETGESSDSDLAEAIQKSGFNKLDLIGFYVVRMIPEWKREGQSGEAEILKLIEARLTLEREKLAITSPFGLKEFQAWYGNHMVKPAQFLAIEVDDTAPLSTTDATFVQKISCVLGIARDQSIVNVIAQTLTTKSNVLVVYGASHFLTERRALEAMLGPPKFQKLF